MGKLSKAFTCNFTQVPNEIINDKSVSLKAKGLYLYFISKPDQWDFSLNGMCSQLKEGKESLLSAIDELCKYGYMRKTKVRNGSKQGVNDYDIFESPYFPSESGNQSLETRVRKPESGNCTTSNTNTSKKEKSNTLSSKGEKFLDFNSFREKFKSAFVDLPFTTNGIGWRSDTEFLIKHGLIYNTVSDRVLNKDEALTVWNYLHEHQADYI